MLTAPVIVAASFAYLGLLFAIAYYGDKRADAGRSIIANPYIYALSLAVYCTAWTFYGSVGRAATTGIGFLPIYLGPTLMAALWWYVMLKIIRISKRNRITSIADFIASRYGKSQIVGGLVTVIVVIGIIPYIALQLKAISNTFLIILEYPQVAMPHKQSAPLFLGDNTFYIAMLLAAFTILFGTRHLDATERHEGMVAAIAFESLVKLLAFIAVGLFVTFWLYDGFGDIFSRAAQAPDLAPLLTLGGAAGSYTTWASLTFLSMAAIMFLPRQWQVTVVENVDERHLAKAIWLFPLYLLAINIFVLPIALGGLMHFPKGTVDADTFVLTLPIAVSSPWLALFAFIGGLSAATGMVIVETIALSTMVCNDLVMPVLLRMKGLRLTARRDLSGLLLGIRRGAIVLILVLGYLYFNLAGEAYALVSIGLISFSAVAQFAPAIIGGIFWRGGTRTGALCGLGAGFLVWLYTLLLPSFAKSGWLPMSFLTQGLFGIELLKPQELFGLSGLDDITHCLFWSMLANIGCYVAISLAKRPSAAEHGQATVFVDALRQSGATAGPRLWRGSASVDELVALLGRFLGPERARDAFESYARMRGARSIESLTADASLVHHVESLLAGAIGSASARVMVSSVVAEEPLGLDEVMNIIDEASQVLAYSRQLEQKSRELEAASAELRAANERLKELDRLKDDFISTVTHELRTPLTSIRAFSEILRDNPRLDEAQRTQFLGTVIKESERLTRLINQVLDLSKIESGNAEWHSSELDMREVVDDSVAAVSQMFRENGVELEVRMPQKLPSIVADRDRLMQVMLNLLSNAAKFCRRPGGRVSIALSRQDGFLRVDVTDNGSGISESDQEVIFEKFRQVGDTLTNRPQGTGLGLPICRQIINHFGGRLWVQSRPGAGATFSFTLPLDPAPAQSLAA
ncbi:MAG TPA: sensor histidine kinase [Burkholderiales bacterium]|jgi:Na+/proline symporter/nitrogen-specific signal transduction histidine kinase